MEIQITRSVGFLSFKKWGIWFPAGLSTCNGVCGDCYVFSCAAHSICMRGKTPMFHTMRLQMRAFGADSIELMVRKAVLSKSWIHAGCLNSDVAFLLAVPSKGEANRIEGIAPVWNYPETDTSAELVVRQKHLFGGVIPNQLLTVNRPVKRLAARNVAQANQDVGDSGGPWLVTDEGGVKQFSNTSFRLKSDRSYSYGPVWNNEVEDMFLETLEDRDYSNNNIHWYFKERKHK